MKRSENKDEQILLALEKATRQKSEFTVRSTERTEVTASGSETVIPYKNLATNSTILSSIGMSKRDITL